MLEDVVLVWKLHRGDPDALEPIYRKYQVLLHTVAGNILADPALAEDVLQDVFVKLVRSAQTVKVRKSLRSFLVTCVANCARDRLRKTQRQHVSPLPEKDTLVSRVDSPVQLAQQCDMAERLQWALAQITGEQREVITLHLHGHLTFRAIAEHLGITLRTAQSRYRYGLEKMRSLLQIEVKP
jgi:RNA polymerase sigma-70 factor (ECF subfamily)